MTVGAGTPATEDAARRAARIVGVALSAMFCAGLLLPKPWLSQTIAWAVLIPAGAWLLVLDRRAPLVRTEPGRLFSLLVGSLALCLLILLASTAVSDFGTEVRLSKQVWSAAICLFTVIAFATAHRSDDQFTRIFGRSVGVCGALAAAILVVVGLANGVDGVKRLEGQPGLHWVLNPNAIGAVYAICFAVAVGHGLRRDISRAERAIFFGAAMLPLLAVLLAQSRGSMLGCAAVVATAVFALPRRVSFSLLTIVLCGVATVALAYPDWINGLVGRGDGSRLGLWRHFLTLSLERPWTGHGLAFDTRFTLARETIYTPHNILLSALVRGGVLAFAAAIVTFAAALAASIRAARRGWWLPLCVLLAALGLGSVDHELIPTTFGYYWYLLWLPLGLAAAAARQPVSGDAGAA